MAGDPYPKSAQVPVTRKRYRRVVASRKQWEKLQAERQGPCLICTWLGGTQELPSTLHHVVPRSRFGDDVAENLVPLCGDGTAGCHGLITRGHTTTCRIFATMLPRLAEDSYAYATDKMTDDGFLRFYRVEFEAV